MCQLVAALGVHRQSIAPYETGALPIPTLVMLAVEALEGRPRPGSKSA